jgi:hypothetical protein
MNEMLLLVNLIAGVALMARWGVFHRFLPASLHQKIRDELSRLTVSAPHLRSTFNGDSFDGRSFSGGSSTSR